MFPTGLIFYSGRSHGISNHHECSAPEGRGFLVLWVQNRIWRIGILLPTCWVPSLHRERASFNNAPFPLRTGSFGWVRGYQDQCLAPAFPRFKYCNSSTETFCKSQNMWISQKKKILVKIQSYPTIQCQKMYVVSWSATVFLWRILALSFLSPSSLNDVVTSQVKIQYNKAR